MSDINPAKALLQLEADPAFQRISQELRKTNFFSILGTADRERWHSNYWAWVLNPNESHGLGMFALRRLLAHAVDDQGKLICQRLGKKRGTTRGWSPSRNTTVGRTSLTVADLHQFEPDLIAAAPSRDTGYSELSFKNGRKSNGRIDILIFLQGKEFDHRYSNDYITLIIGIECKVRDSYKHTQLESYANWLLKDPYCDCISDPCVKSQIGTMYDQVSNQFGGIFSFGLFLSKEKPSPNSEAIPSPHELDPQWSSVTYDDLIETILEPMSRHPNLDQNGVSLVNQYMHLVSLPNTYISNRTMQLHRDLVNQLIERHEDAFNIIADVLQSDSEHEEVGSLIEQSLQDEITRARHLSPRDLFEHGLAKPGDRVIHRPIRKQDIGRQPFKETVVAELVEVDDATDHRSALLHVSGGGITIDEPVSSTNLLKRIYEAHGSEFKGSGNSYFYFAEGEYKDQTLSAVYDECRDIINQNA